MGDIISLKAARKQKARFGKDAQAAENRVKFGRTKAEKTLEEAQAKLVEQRLDAHKRDD